MFIGILGGGLGGISLQRFLEQDSEILEKEDRPGGLCRTFKKDGFSYDIGGHILFSEDKKINSFVKKVLAHNINLCRRNNKILFKGKYVKYPFENGLGLLDKQDIYECFIGYLKNNYSKPSNFKEWIYYTFGDGIAKKYLIPYNSKIWKFPLDKMESDWVEKIPKPPLEDMVKSVLGIETEGYLQQLYFTYPRRGGIEALIKILIKDNSKLITNFEIKKIQKRKKIWFVSDGDKERRYDKLIITLPIKKAINCIDNVPPRVRRAADNLKHNSVRIVLIGLNNKSLLDKSAIYIPNKDIIVHRICYMGYFSKNMVPCGCSSLLAEITTYQGHNLYNISDSTLIHHVIDGLCKINVINKRDIITTEVKNIEYAYVIHDLKRRKNMEILKEFFASLGIELLGRFAEFEYINMDEVIKRSLKMAEKLN